jgi:hypothetical protein
VDALGAAARAVDGVTPMGFAALTATLAPAVIPRDGLISVGFAALTATLRAGGDPP